MDTPTHMRGVPLIENTVFILCIYNEQLIYVLNDSQKLYSNRSWIECYIYRVLSLSLIVIRVENITFMASLHKYNK